MIDKLKPYLVHIVAIVSFLMMSLIYFFPQAQGKSLRQGDIVNYKAMVKEVNDHYERTGEHALWTNSMFAGMPTYQMAAPQKTNVLRYVDKAYNLFIPRPMGYFIGGMIGFYILMLVLGVNPWLGIIVSIAFALGTNNLVLFEAGHTSKIRAIFYIAPLIAGIILAYRGKFLVGASLYALFMGLSLFVNHPQMIYYLFIVMLIFVGMRAYQDYKSGSMSRFIKASGYLAIASLIALGSSASKIWTTLEYAEDTMRGKPILELENKTATSSSETDGLEFGYANMWSNGMIDNFASVIPGVAGGGSAETIGSNSAIAQDLKSKNLRVPKNFQAPLYWGALPVTSGPIYFGVIIVFLFVFGMFATDSKLKWWLFSAVILTFMFSMGKNLAWFNELFHNYFPLFNKFRTPNSVLSITAVLMPILGFIAINDLVKEKISKERAQKALLISGGIMGALCLFFAFVGPSMFDFSSPNDARYAQTFDPEALQEDRISLMRGDALRSLFYVLLVAGAIWYYLKSKIGSTTLFGILAAFIIYDAIDIGKRYLNPDDFVSKSALNQSYAPRPVDNQIKRDPDPHYRVLDMSVDTWNSAIPSYHHKTIGGYHPAKLQRIQDLIDRHISQGNQNVLNMLNTKYFIMPDNTGQAGAQQNPSALGNAWFVSEVKLVANANEEIEALSNFDPAKTAIVHNEFQSYVGNYNSSVPASISLANYAPDKLVYISNSSEEKLAVFSEMWYGPNKGWNSYIDGEKVDHIRVNYALRALKVPAGEHNIEFRFEPSSYKYGEMLSLIFSLGIVLFGAYLIYLNFKSNTNSELVSAETKPKSKAKTKKSKN